MADLMRPELVATEVWRKPGPFDVYDSLTDLENWGFKPGEMLFPFPYDWRKSNGTAAQQLGDLVEKITAQHNGDVVITLLAHSKGGLVARYYLESGAFANRPGFSRVKHLFTTGTPHRGAPLALTAALGMEKRVFLSASQVLQLISDARFPAVYELLPPLGEPFLWNNAGKHDPLDVYSQKIATDPGGLNLNASNLQAAQTFRLGLDFVRKPALLFVLRHRPPHVRISHVEHLCERLGPVFCARQGRRRNCPVNIDTNSHPELINPRFAYVSVSRAAQEAQIFTNAASSLTASLSQALTKTSAIEMTQRFGLQPERKSCPDATCNRKTSKEHVFRLS